LRSQNAHIPHFVVAKIKRMNYILYFGKQALEFSSWQNIKYWLPIQSLGWNCEVFMINFRDLTFAEATNLWLDERSLTNKPGTIQCYRDYIARLKPSFAGMKLAEIQPWHLLHYQKERKNKYHPASINHDCNTLLQILGWAGLRQEIEQHYRPLRVPEWQPPRVLTEAEEEAFFTIAGTNPDWALAYYVASLTNNTSASGKELRLLQLKDVDLEADPPILSVPRDMKNSHRQRRIPLNERGCIQVQRLLDRARALGCTGPDHYLFPFRDKRSKLYDPTRPASESWLKYQWKKMVSAALEQGAIGFPIKPHNLRHQIITKLLEDGQPEEVVRAIAGHVSRKMMEHYSHARIQRKFQALDAINPDRKRAAKASTASPAKNFA
jgi:integrase